MALLDAIIYKRAGYDYLNQFGRNADIGTGTAEDIWSAGGTYVWQTSAQLHDIVSSSTDDDDGGTGANTVEVIGLDANYAAQTETVTMNGTSNVATANTYIRIYRMRVLTAGSGGVAAGDITATGQTEATEFARIETGNNISEMAIYTVPANYTGLLYDFWASINPPASSTIVTIKLCVREPSSVFQCHGQFAFNSAGRSKDGHDWGRLSVSIPEKSDVKLTAEVDQVNQVVTGGFDIAIVPNTHFGG